MWLHIVLAQVSDFRKLVDGKIGDKHEEVMSRMGAIMAAGILDAGHHHSLPACGFQPNTEQRDVVCTWVLDCDLFRKRLGLLSPRLTKC